MVYCKVCKKKVQFRCMHHTNEELDAVEKTPIPPVKPE